MYTHRIAKMTAALFLGVCLVSTAAAQQKIGFVDSAFILDKLPEYKTVQDQIDRQAKEWEDELAQMQTDVDELFRQYQARELLYTNEERKRKRDEIVAAESELERLRRQYFGPDGELFTRQEQLMMPIQERIFAAVEEIATREGYDYIVDKGSDYFFMFAREQHNLSNKVLEELGIDVENPRANTGQPASNIN